MLRGKSREKTKTIKVTDVAEGFKVICHKSALNISTFQQCCTNGSNKILDENKA